MANLDRSEHKETKMDSKPDIGKAPMVRDVGRDRAIELAVSTIEKQFGKGSIMRLGEDIAPPEVQVVPTGALGLDIALGMGGLPRGRIVEIYGPESSGKTTLALARGGAGAAIGRHLRLRRRRARARRRLRAQAGREDRRPAGVAARSRRAGARDHRDAGALGRGRRHGGRLGGGADPARRVGRRDGRFPRGPAGAPHEPGAAQADRHHLQVQHPGHLHQPDPHEDRRDVRQPETTTGGNALKFYASVRLDIRRVGASRTAKRSSATAPA
jgi:recombination protein RecA